MSNAFACRRFLVSGRVQGVFFRGSTAREAGRLGLSGSATNLPDGRVVVLVSGAAGKVEELSRWLASGPPLAKVTDIDVEHLDTDAGSDWSGFTVG